MSDFAKELGAAIEGFSKENAAAIADPFISEKAVKEYEFIEKAAKILHRLLTEGPTEEMLNEVVSTETRYRTLYADEGTMREVFNAMLQKAIEQ